MRVFVLLIFAITLAGCDSMYAEPGKPVREDIPITVVATDGCLAMRCILVLEGKPGVFGPDIYEGDIPLKESKVVQVVLTGQRYSGWLRSVDKDGAEGYLVMDDAVEHLHGITGMEGTAHVFEPKES